MEDETNKGVVDAPVDGPSRDGGGVTRSDPGASSQDAPGGRSPAQGKQDALAHDGGSEAQDTNERADEVATVRQPD